MAASPPAPGTPLGQIFLEGGLWAGERILASDWVEQATEAAMAGRYGSLWWGGDYQGGESRFHAFAARGWGGQAIIVFPRLDMVVVLAGGNYETPEPVDAIIAGLVLGSVR